MPPFTEMTCLCKLAARPESAPYWRHWL